MGQNLRKQLVAATIISVPDGVEDMAADLGTMDKRARNSAIENCSNGQIVWTISSEMT
jgi:hypothetical protein